MYKRSKLLRTAMTVTSIVAVATVASACGSMRVSSESFIHVLDTQNELLSQLREERKSEPVSEKVRADRDLQTAERSLNETVFAVEHSNKVLKYILKNEDKD